MGVVLERIGRQRQIERCRALANAAGRVVDRAMARAEPALVLALIAERHAAQMRADADHHQPLRLVLLDAVRIGLWIAQRGDVDALRRLDLVLAAVTDEDRLAAPEDLDLLAD